MIRVLAQIVLRQVGALKGVRLDEADRSPALRQATKVPTHVSLTTSGLPTPSPSRVAAEEAGWPDPPSQALVGMFTALAQRRVQAALSKEEFHEDHPNHHGPS